MAIRRRRFLRLLPGRIHRFQMKAVTFGGNSAWTDELPIRTSDVSAIAWTVADTEAAIKAVPKFWLRHIRVTWAPIGQPLRFSHYLLFRYDMGVGPTYPTAARDAAIVQSGTDIDDGTYEDNPNFLKDTGRLPLYIDKVSEDVDTAAAGDNNAVTEHRYDYWVYAIDIQGTKSSNYLGPDNAEFGKPNTPEIIIPTAAQETAFGIEADSDNFFVTEVKPLNKHWCDVRVVWNCPGGAEYYLLQYRRKNAILNPFKLWSFPLRVDHETDEETFYEEAYPLIEGGQKVTLHTLMTNEDYEFRVKAVNVPAVLVSEWSTVGEYRTERDPYPPAEVEDVSARRMQLYSATGILSQKGEHIKIIWKRPDWALLQEQINFYRIFRYKGTVADAETVTDLINAWDGTGTLTYNSQNLLLDQKFLGTAFIDDDVLPLASGGGSSFNAEAFFEGADDPTRRTMTVAGSPVVGTLQAAASIGTTEVYEGTYSLENPLGAGAKYIEWIDNGIVDLNTGYLSFWAHCANWTWGSAYYMFVSRPQTNDYVTVWHSTVSGRYITIQHRGAGTLAEVRMPNSEMVAKAGQWIQIEARWDTGADILECRIDGGTWHDYQTFGTGTLTPSAVTPTAVRLGHDSAGALAYYDKLQIDLNFSPSPDPEYYHYWTAAVDTYEDLDNPGTNLEQQSVVSMNGVTITKADDSRYDGTTGTGESYDIVTFEAPDPVELLTPIAADDPGINLVQTLFGKKYSVKFRWTDVEEATYYRTRVRITPPRDGASPTAWFLSPRIDQARANRDADDNIPFRLHPVPMEKGTLVEWTVISGNIAGESAPDTASFTIIGDTTPPGKVAGLTGDCKGIAALAGVNIWLAVTLRWNARPNGEGVDRYEVFMDGINPAIHFVDDFKHSFVAGIASTKMTRNIWWVEPSGAASHIFRVRAVDETGKEGEFSDPVTVNFEPWWVF